ncbi:XrtA/PEP-CTERM system TPR-repeat protein PrsT [Sulfuricystis multivorans]|uniref:XrtA/PEP-CTERM system TPR-repeat protein PrsT n=1 Tax=Sulfuricystis multivorans TaxID=2211108 RepID=UPI000F81BAAC|nr:XrtA/PEP-CTERM system TPR-repeat protein PrsT [Sulfuricystis multivorans]
MTSLLHRTLAIATLVAALVGTACGDSPEAMLASAKEYLAKNDQAAATIQLKNVLAKNPDSAEARFLLGKALLENGDVTAAEVELRKALELKHPADQVVPLLARVLLAQSQFKKLDELAKTSIASAEGLADLKTTLAQSLAMQGKPEAARTMLDEALAAKSDFAPALLLQARIKVANNDLAGAHAIIDGILARAPQDVNAWLFKADLLNAEGKTAEAVAAYEKGLALKPQALNAHAALIMTHLRERQPEKAAKQLEAMQKVAPKHPLTYYEQGLLAFTKKDLATAKSAVDNLLKLQPDSPQGLQLAGLVAFESRSDLQAQDYLRKALQKAPALALARRTLVLSYLRSGQSAKAVETLQPVLHGDETAPTWLELAGNAYLQNGDAKTAEEFFQRATKANPQNKKAQTALALARLRGGHTAEALGDLEAIAASSETDTSADMALIVASIRTRQFDKALQAIANLEKKRPDHPLVHNLRGGALLAKGDQEGARKSFEKALAIDPAYLPAASALAQMDLRANRPEEAQKRFEAVLAKDPKNAQAMLALAELRARGGAKTSDLVELIKRAIDAAPAEPAPRLALIGAYLREQDKDKALAAVQEALAAIPDRPELLDAAGRVYQMNGDNQQALTIYSKLANLMPTSPQPYLRMAEIQLAAKNREGARSSLTKGLSALPDSLALQRALIQLDLEEGKLEAALARAREIQKAQPQQSVGYLFEGDAHAANKAWAQAANAYRAGLKAAPATELAQRLHAVLLADGKTVEARAHADAWLKQHPKDHAFRLYLAEQANRNKDFATAAAHYRNLLANQPNNPALLNNLAWTLGQMKDPQALSLAERANSLAPNQPAIMDTLGMLLVERGEGKRGVELLAKAVELQPQAALIRLNYAKALIKTGDKNTARRELEELSKLGERFPAQAEVAALLKSL